MSDIGPEPFDHPQLTPVEDALQRGGDPDPPHHDAGPPAPTYESDPARRAMLQGSLPSIIGSRRFRQDLLLPYLLIRAFPGDHGIRPIPPGRTLDRIHPESPDIVVVPGEPQQVAGLDGQTLTLEPGPGPHTIFVRVWNLGLLPAIGVTLSVSEIHLDEVEGTGFTFYSSPVVIAQGFFDLPDCYSPGCRAVIKIGRPWLPAPSATTPQSYSRYLIAKVSCFADRASDTGDSFSDRHVAGRGLLS